MNGRQPIMPIHGHSKKEKQRTNAWWNVVLTSIVCMKKKHLKKDRWSTAFLDYSNEHVEKTRMTLCIRSVGVGYECLR